MSNQPQQEIDPFEMLHELEDLPDISQMFKDGGLTAVMNSIINTEDFGVYLSNMYNSDPIAFRKELETLQEMVNKAANQFYADAKGAVIKDINERTINYMEQIIAFDGIFVNVPVKICRLTDTAQLPCCQDMGDAGADIYADEDVVILPLEKHLVSTGWKVIVPGGYRMEILPRSGMALKTAMVIANSPGTIDAGYRGEVKIIMHNTGDSPYKIKKGDRIAQALLTKVPRIEWNEISEDEYALYSNERGEGFGSSGK